MTAYEVAFEATTGLSIDVEADSEAEARTKAQAELDNLSAEWLPEVWPSDLRITEVRANNTTIRYAK